RGRRHLGNFSTRYPCLSHVRQLAPESSRQGAEIPPRRTLTVRLPPPVSVPRHAYRLGSSRCVRKTGPVCSDRRYKPAIPPARTPKTDAKRGRKTVSFREKEALRR